MQFSGFGAGADRQPFRLSHRLHVTSRAPRILSSREHCRASHSGCILQDMHRGASLHLCPLCVLVFLWTHFFSSRARAWYTVGGGCYDNEYGLAGLESLSTESHSDKRSKASHCFECAEVRDERSLSLTRSGWHHGLPDSERTGRARRSPAVSTSNSRISLA